MSTTNLINLNVDTLFEQHSVPEIDIVQKKIQTVVESKREELRTMVGERYRDLLKAADTIAAMRESSGTLISQVGCISSNCRSLNEQQLIGFKTTDATDLLRSRSANKQLNNYFSAMVQIKLLTALPELIWSHIDQEHFHAATELFIFSRHVSTGLQLDVNNPLMHSLPVARKQWEISKPFHITIKQSVLAVLEREELGAEVAVDCLLSLLLLENNNLNGVLKTFLQLRSAAFTGSLTDVYRQQGDKRRVKDRILASFRVLNSTMELISKCFLENGLLYQNLAEYSDPNAPPTIALMDSNDAQFAHMLPEIISNFRPKFEAHALDDLQLRAAIEQWLTDTSSVAQMQLLQLFDLVSTMNTIQELKYDMNIYKNEVNFVALAEKCGLSQSLNFYESKYAPLISQRVRDIIRDSWRNAMNDTFGALQRTLEYLLQGRSNQQLWEDVSSDLPQSLAEALNDDRKAKKLLMKTKGYDENIISICANFESQLSGIISEMNVLLAEHVTRSDEKLALIEFLREVAQNQLTEFISKVKGLNLQQSERNQLLVLVRLLCALVELCPNLKISFCQQSSWRQYIGQMTPNASNAWQRNCLLLEKETSHFWLQIITGILEETRCQRYLSEEISHEDILEYFAMWESVALEQKDDQDNSLHSSFRIPNQPRISLQLHLFHVIRSLNDSVPQTLPPQVLHTFNHELLTQLLTHYDSLQATSQNVALQLYFDLKFLQNVFAVSREERVLFDQFQTLINRLKDAIDPFDFELFVEHLSSNIKRSVSKLSCLLGVLSPNTSAINASATPVSITQERDPNVLSLSSNGSSSVWFPLLPIIEPGSGSEAQRGLALERRNVTSMQSEKLSTPLRKSTSNLRKSDATKSKSGAAAFFGAMSQEWFR